METLTKVVDERNKMIDAVQMLTDALRHATTEREQLLERAKVLKQQLKDQEIEFGRRKSHQMMLLEATYGGKDKEKPLVPPGRYGR
jgi:hypothetical protein